MPQQNLFTTPMQIANPIYDVVFKYLMEDSRVAKLLLSSIIGETIEELTFLPIEFAGDIDGEKTRTKRERKIMVLTVYRLDFAAKIKTPDGYKQVIIEIQKAKFPTDIMRFRRYLGQQFGNRENVQRIKVNNKYRKTGTPIISIYFLGHKLDYTTASVVKISRQYTDLITGEKIEVKESFIESLTLDSYVIQIPYLTQKRRTDLEILLSVFDQSKITAAEHHILNVNEKDFPDKYRPIVRKLQEAIQNAEIRKKMELEDGIIDELEDLEREIEDRDQIIEEITQEKEMVKQSLLLTELQARKAEQEKQKAEQEKQQAEQEKQKAEQEKQQAEQQIEQLRNELEALRKLLKNKE